VIAPYATFPRRTVAPEAVLDNLELLSRRRTGRQVRVLRGDSTNARAPAGGETGVPLLHVQWRSTRACSHESALDNVINSSRAAAVSCRPAGAIRPKLLCRSGIPGAPRIPREEPSDPSAPTGVPAARRPPAVVRRYVTPHTLSPSAPTFCRMAPTSSCLTNAAAATARAIAAITLRERHHG